MSVPNLAEVKRTVRSARARQLAGTALPRDNYPLTAEVCMALIMELEAARGRDTSANDGTRRVHDCLVFQTCEGEPERFHRDLRGVDEETARTFAEQWTRPPTPEHGLREWDLKPRVVERRAVIIKVERTLVVQMRGDRDGHTVDEERARRAP